MSPDINFGIQKAYHSYKLPWHTTHRLTSTFWFLVHFFSQMTNPCPLLIWSNVVFLSPVHLFITIKSLYEWHLEASWQQHLVFLALTLTPCPRSAAQWARPRRPRGPPRRSWGTPRPSQDLVSNKWELSITCLTSTSMKWLEWRILIVWI